MYVSKMKDAISFEVVIATEVFEEGMML
jgi:hypothetical protein